MDSAQRFSYPFSAIVGQDDMKTALMLVAVQPRIGGVLISGERGTAKTTAVRAMPGILNHAERVVELPLNATEDRVVGTLRIDALMKTGEREFVPGVLAEANGSILYVDEINLLEDHIVDLLLDAAATGICHIEREGVSRTYPAQFVLVGTMNPEEGSLRPQLLDRFGLSVKVSGSLTQDERLELLRRHMAFEDDPEAFCARYEQAERDLAERIRMAGELYPSVAYPDAMTLFAAGICSELAVDGYRADLTLMRTARAVAALDGRSAVESADVLLAARYVLPHRMKRLPFEEVELTEAMLEKAADAHADQLVAPASPHEGESQAAREPACGEVEGKKATGQRPR